MTPDLPYNLVLPPSPTLRYDLLSPAPVDLEPEIFRMEGEHVNY